MALPVSLFLPLNSTCYILLAESYLLANSVHTNKEFSYSSVALNKDFLYINIQKKKIRNTFFFSCFIC